MRDTEAREDPGVLRVLASVGWTHDQAVGSPEPPDTPYIERPRVNEPVHPVKRKLTELLYFIEDKRESWNMNEGDYLELTNKLKETFDTV